MRRIRTWRAFRIGIIVAAAAFSMALVSGAAAYILTGEEGTSTSASQDIDRDFGASDVTHIDERINAIDKGTPIAFTDPAEHYARDVADAYRETDRRAHEEAAAAEAARHEAEAQAAEQAARDAEAARVAANQAAAQQAAATAQQARLEAARATAATPLPATPAATAARTPAAQSTVASALSDGSWIQNAAAAAGWPADQLAKVERVVICESSGNTAAVSPGGYVGLMQVAPWLHGAVPADAVGQLAQAYGVYLHQGWGAWPVCGR